MAFQNIPSERLESQIPLNWSTRKRIALGSAKGLAYLHDKCDPKIIHRDVKAANILLDEDFEAVVADFELAKLMDHNDSHVDTVRGTIGHIAPEYLSTGKLTEKADVFGYGVFLLELITGQCAFDFDRLANDDDVMLLEWVKKNVLEKKWSIFLDADCQADSDLMEEEVEKLMKLSLVCTQTSPEERPKMSEIVRMLEEYDGGLVERWEQWHMEEMLHSPKTNWTIADDTSGVVERWERWHMEEMLHSPKTNWTIADDTSDIPPDELSGPR